MPKEIKLKENDNKLLGFCLNQKQSVGDIANYLDIKPASISFRIKKLKKAGLITVTEKGRGKKTFVRTKKGDKTQEYFLEILTIIKQRGGRISDKEYFSLLPFDFGKPETKDKFQAPQKLLSLQPSLLKREISMTSAGEKFLKEKKK